MEIERREIDFETNIDKDENYREEEKMDRENKEENRWDNKKRIITYFSLKKNNLSCEEHTRTSNNSSSFIVDKTVFDFDDPSKGILFT